MYVGSIYVCVCVCRHATDRQYHARYACVCMYVCMYVCVYIYIYIYIHLCMYVDNRSVLACD